MLEQAAHVLISEGHDTDESPAIKVAKLLTSDSIEAPSSQESLVRLAILDTHIRRSAGSADSDTTVLESFTRQLISNIKSSSEREGISAALDRRESTKTSVLDHDTLGKLDELVPKVLISRDFVELKGQKLRNFLDHSASDAAMRAVVTSSFVNSGIPFVAGAALAVPGRTQTY
ncbi:hypothetical protein QZM22_22105 [Burkholderia oklahomensis]|uniref:hypothetical protein n=1 Tax=Burkholderia oklahomensis TaxID=342113 RepID=UPI0026565A94|nr:hypothetical protein [Burkholderia oklahomensis]MDN7675139.1 hypothetical protein [Burkholderia oklahomensis]